MSFCTYAAPEKTCPSQSQRVVYVPKCWDKYCCTLAVMASSPRAPRPRISSIMAVHPSGVLRWETAVVTSWHALHIDITSSRPGPGGNTAGGNAGGPLAGTMGTGASWFKTDAYAAKSTG